MLRLADRIAGMKTAHFPEVDEDTFAQQYGDLAKHAIRSGKAISFLADNCYEHVKKSGASTWHWSDYPCLMPPFDFQLIEWNLPNGIQLANARISQLGWFVMCCPLSESDDWRSRNPEGEHLVVMSLWMSVSGVPTFTGTGISFSLGQSGELVGPGGIFGKNHLIDSTELVCSMAWPAMQCLGFLNCGNISREDADSREFAEERWRRRQKCPEITYKVLKLNAPKFSRQESSTTCAYESFDRRLHICRGHFATYNEDKPLFGRVTGTFWKPAHVRGSAKEGVVVKDYAVKAPVMAKL